MKKYSVIIIVLILFACKSDKEKIAAETFYMPAEWEEQEAVWLGWSKAIETGYYSLTPTIIKTLSSQVCVKIAFNSNNMKEKAVRYLQSRGIDSTMYKSYIIPGERYWIRDIGATFLVNKKGELGAVDFEWDDIGLLLTLKQANKNNMDTIKKYYAEDLKGIKRGSLVDSMIAQTEHAKMIKTKIVHEGGAIEVNGKGTLILCEATVLPRNPNWTKKQLELEFKKTLGVSNIIWLKQGLAEDPFGLRLISKTYAGYGVGGHTDEFVRFANSNTILLAWVDEKEKDINPVNKINYLRMKENYDILKNAKDQDGKPFSIIKIPQPDIIVKKMIVTEKIKKTKSNQASSKEISVTDFLPAERPNIGDTIRIIPCTSYMNYFVTNNIVLVPTYIPAGSSRIKEMNVKKILKKQFPNRKIIFLNAISENWDGGGIHCITQQQPKLN